MKYLSNYMEEKQTKLFKEKKVFFAFSKEQFSEGVKKHKIKTKVIGLGSGMFCPKKNGKTVLDTLDKIYKESICQDIKENGVDNIILRELLNHEAFVVGDVEDTEHKLSDYPITKEQIIEVYYKNYKNYA